MSSVLLDGKFERGLYVGRPVIAHPFADEFGDYNTLVITRQWRQRALSYFPGRRGVDKDPKFNDAYLVTETEPAAAGHGDVIGTTRVFARIPPQLLRPLSYNFASPNFTPVNWSSAFTTVPPGSYAIAGNYAVIALASFTPSVNPVTTAICEAITGYYDQARTISAYTGNPATVLTIASHNCTAGARLIYRRTDGTNKYYYFDVSSVSGNDLTGTSTEVATSTGNGAGMANYLLPLILTSADKARKRTRATTDRGESIMLVSEVVENFYLPGVTSGIDSHDDITPVTGFTLASYLEQWASTGTWFNVTSNGLKSWRGPILVSNYQRALRPAS